MIPFVDLKAQYQSIKSEIEAAVARVLQNSSFILGPEVERFERNFAQYIGTRFCVAVNSGTAALHLALMAGGIGDGNEVIVPSNSFIATAESVSVVSATPVFVDAEEAAYTIAVSEIETRVTERTRAIMPVHLYGQPADLDPIFEIARRHGLLVIEDAAQAHGAEYKGRRVGALGDAGCFSFYPSKNLGAYGEGGAVVTNDEDFATRVRLLRDHGSSRRYYHDLIGYNFRMEGIQGAILNVKLHHLDEWNALRRAHAATYNKLLDGAGLVRPSEMPYAHHVYHAYVIQSAARDELYRRLTANGIQAGIHYPIPIHLQPAYAPLGYKKGDLPITERLCERVLSLPMFPELTRAQIETIAAIAAPLTESTHT
jgi:dTDP-4-amino-4,6-dideoxygalactose transaminase